MNNHRPTVLFYPTGIVHYRNLEILKTILPDFRFRVIVEPWVHEKAVEVLEKIKPEDRVAISNQVPAEIWDDTDILFLSMAYPNPFRLNLVYEAALRNIPVTAIEEVNQLALNDGIINHYFLPIDYFGVPSDVEKDAFIQLGIPETSLHVTGWPFFNEKEVIQKPYQKDGNIDIRQQYNIPPETKCCLLILGSLKEHDIVSLETRHVRQQILETVSGGLPEDVKLLIKPHPIETEEGLATIKQQVPNAVLIGPKIPIEPLLDQADVVVNRGNSQVALLAIMQDKPVIIVPAGLRTIFHEHDSQKGANIIADSAPEFLELIEKYNNNGHQHYQTYCKKIQSLHFPLTQDQALSHVNDLFTTALQHKKKDRDREYKDRIVSISIQYAFLGDTAKAINIIEIIESPGQAKEFSQIAPLLKRLYQEKISPEDFDDLLDHFPEKIPRWHLQALFLRVMKNSRDKDILSRCVPLLAGFDGDVNPHYFMEDILTRIRLEYEAGDPAVAEALIEKFLPAYGVFDYYQQAFDMIRSVYSRTGGRTIRKGLWLVGNINKAYTRKLIKDKLKRKQ